MFISNLDSDAVELVRLESTWTTQTSTTKSSAIIFNVLQLSPLEINVTYKDRPTEYKKLRKSPNALLGIIKALLGNFEKAPLRLNALKISPLSCKTDELSQIIKSHYKSQLSFNILMAIGASDFIGNPINVAKSISRGVSDFFVKPSEAEDPVELAQNIFKGTYSVISSGVNATFGTASTITSTVSKGLLSIAQDEDYNKEREESKRTKKSFFGGIGSGLFGFGKSIVSGLTGVVMKPIEGGMSEGIGGAFKVNA